MELVFGILAAALAIAALAFGSAIAAALFLALAMALVVLIFVVSPIENAARAVRRWWRRRKIGGMILNIRAADAWRHWRI